MKDFFTEIEGDVRRLSEKYEYYSLITLKYLLFAHQYSVKALLGRTYLPHCRVSGIRSE
ncbi:hypothetical protein KIN20_010911 [Parelaphostrongylus tenuis]|uniref:Uncharacterized protein n=1 Tax=Parelaphostrongylus tenuis TaxID=148309 RepID=A0AAD5MD90_PARTN|nr:hypothetical protein KIN20_010911 [Parelaphostrongylus tenuis]